MQHDEEDRFARFARAQSPALFRVAYLMTGDHQRAEDLLQGTLVRLYQRWSRVEAMDRPAAYARRVLVRQSVSRWRRRSCLEVPLLLGDHHVGVDLVERFAAQQRTWPDVLKLPPRQRAVTVLRHYEHLNEAEIVAALGMAPGTMMSHAHAAFRTLGSLFGGRDVPGAQPAREPAASRA